MHSSAASGLIGKWTAGKMGYFRIWLLSCFLVGSTQQMLGQSTVDQLCKEALDAFNKRDFGLALSKSEAALKMDSLSTEAHRIYQDVKRQGSDRTLTIAWYRERVLQYPTNAVYAYLYARMLRDNVDSMKIFLRRAVELDPNYFWGYVGLASVLWSKAETAQEALDLLSRAESIRPHTAIVRDNRALAYLSMERYDEALPVVHQMYENEVSGKTYNFNTTFDYLGRVYKGLVRSHGAVDEAGKEKVRRRIEAGLKLYALDARALGVIMEAAKSDSLLDASLWKADKTAITPRQLIGRWESVNRTRGGLGSTFEVIDDGLCVLISGALVDGTYRTAGDSLYFSMADLPTKTTAVWFTVAGDSMIQSFQGRERRKVMRRVAGTSATRSIQGIWWYQRETGATTFEEYTEDGKSCLRVYMSRDSCLYAISGGVLTTRSLKLTGKDSQWRILVTDSSLTMIPVEGKNTQVFRRVDIGRERGDGGLHSFGFGLSYEQILLVEELARAAMPKAVQTVQSNKEAMIRDLNMIAAGAFQYRARPTSLGGGQSSYTGFSITRSMSSNQNATYVATVWADSILIIGTSKMDARNTIRVVADAKGRLNGWDYGGDFK